MPEAVLDAACTEIEDKREWGMFTRRYGTKEPLSSILVVITKNPDAKEEIDKAKYEQWLRDNSKDLEGTETKRYDDYPVIIGRNTSTYIVGGFWFSWFACQIQCTGKYAEMKYFDFVVRTILANLGLAAAPAPYKPEEPDPDDTGPNAPGLSVEKVEPDRVELAENGNVVFKVTVSNFTSLGKTAKAIVIRLIDGNGREIGRGSIDRLPNHEKKAVEVNAFIEVGDELNTRDIAVELSCPAAARTQGNKIGVKATRPAMLSMQIEPQELVLDTEMEPPEFKLILKNTGDQRSPDLLLQCFIEGTDFASDKEPASSVGGGEDKERGSDLEKVTGNVMEKYIKEKFSFLEAATLRIVLTDASAGTVLCEGAISYRMDGSLRTRLRLDFGSKQAAFDFTDGVGAEIELPSEEPTDTESGNSDLERRIRLGTPFKINLAMTGVTNVEDVCVEMLDSAGKPVASWNMPVLYASFICDDFDPPEAEIKALPDDDSFVAAVGCREGNNELTVRLRKGTETLQQERVLLTIKGQPGEAKKPGEGEVPVEPKPREPGEKEEPNLMGRLIKAQKEQKEFMKKFFMSGATIDEFTIHLYPEGSDLYEELEGSASWNHEKRELRLFAGETEEELRFQMAHELAHLVAFDLVRRLGYVDKKGYPGKVPVWFLEGLAECAAIKWAEKTDPGYYLTNRALTNFKTDVENGNSPIGTLNKVIEREERKVHGFEYAAVGTFVEYLHKECGGGKTLVSIWVDAAEDGKLEEAIERHAGESLNSLRLKWEFFLKDWYNFKIDGTGEKR